MTGYQVSNSIVATLRDISKAGTTIDGVVGVAENAVQIESIGFSASNPNVVEDQARRGPPRPLWRAHGCWPGRPGDPSVRVLHDRPASDHEFRIRETKR